MYGASGVFVNMKFKHREGYSQCFLFLVPSVALLPIYRSFGFMLTTGETYAFGSYHDSVKVFLENRPLIASLMPTAFICYN